jgi:hypothetical protein
MSQSVTRNVTKQKKKKKKKKNVTENVTKCHKKCHKVGTGQANFEKFQEFFSDEGCVTQCVASPEQGFVFDSLSLLS